MRLVDNSVLGAFLDRLDATFARPGRLYLIGETSLVLEGWRPWTGTLEFCAEVDAGDQPALRQAVRAVRAELGIDVHEESPADLIPLPDGYAQRALPVPWSRVSNGKRKQQLQLFHFDPYSVAFRFIARGDEPDYHLVIAFLRNGWLTLAELEAKLNALLPRFSFQTIQQDPAEFRRKYKGLLQMWRSMEGTVVS